MKKIIHSFLLVFFVQQVIAQSVGIGTATPHSSALVDMNSTSKGVLMPCMTIAQRNAIMAPATGLMVFQTDGARGLCYYNGHAWVMLTGNALTVTGDSPDYGITITLAGSGAEGSADGAGATASFSSPTGIAVDVLGNVYVADPENHVIRKITATGIVTTFAGSGIAGAVDATGTAASFNYPVSVATDEAGNVYVSDMGNQNIRKITAAGVVTTLAGNGSYGAADGPGTAASFNLPMGLAVDASGNVYVADMGNQKIRKITATGLVTTLAGSGIPGSVNADSTAASFNNPHGVAVDAAGNVYVADRGNLKIRKISPAGAVTTFAGSGASGSADGSGTAASFGQPTGIAIDDYGNLYVADNSVHKIRKITATGMVTTLAGSGQNGAGDGYGASVQFNYPFSVAVDPVPGNVYVADYLNHKIRKIIAH